MKGRFFIMTLISIWSMAISLRFMIDGYLNNCAYYVNIFDFFFDWSILFLLGFSLYLTCIYDLIKNSKGYKAYYNKYKKEVNNE